MTDNNDKKKKAAAVAVAGAMLAGGVAGAGADMQSDENAYLAALNPKPVVQMIDDNVPIHDDGAAAVDDQKQTQQKQMGQTIAKILLTPFYAAGAVLMRLGEIVMTGVLAPAAAIILHWLILAAVVLGVLAACLKIAFPNVPLRKMLTKKGVVFVLIATAVISAVCGIIPLIWPKAALAMFILKVAGGFAIVLAIFATVLKFIPQRKKPSAQTI